MLILIGTVPPAYALNHAVTAQRSLDFVAISAQASEAIGHYETSGATPTDDRAEVTRYVRTHTLTPETIPAVRHLMATASASVLL